MIIRHSTTHTYRFDELRKDIFDQETHRRVRIITSVVLSLELFDEPDDDGRTFFIDHTFLGWECGEDGMPDKRQGSPHTGVATYLYNRPALLANFIHELALLSGNRVLIDESRQWVLDTGGA